MEGDCQRCHVHWWSQNSNGNRTWLKLYDPVNTTAPAVQRPTDMGENLIGKTKTVQFANAGRVTAIRGLSRYVQSKSRWLSRHWCFSAGAGSATARYDWVDMSICSDPGGSIRIPASKQGAFALRPSFGAVSNDGVMLEGEYFDSI